MLFGNSLSLGLANELAAIGVRTAEVSYFSKHGKLIWSEPRGLAAGYNWPQFSVHRGKLQMLLYQAVLERLGREAVHTGTTVGTWDETQNKLILQLVDTASEEPCGTAEGHFLSQPMASTPPHAPSFIPTKDDHAGAAR